MSVFRIKDLDFEIEEAVLRGHLADELRWSLSIDAKLPQGRFRGEEWTPRAYSENLFPIGGKVLEQWSDVLGQTVEWDDCYDAKTGDPIASLCVYEHLDIYKSKLVLGPQIDHKLFALDWQARCDVSFDEDYGRDLELAIQTNVKFEGIEVPSQDEKDSLELLRKHIRGGEFTFDPGDGRIYKSIFRPN